MFKKIIKFYEGHLKNGKIFQAHGLEDTVK